VIARTFDRVCAVLDELGYLDGDTVTADGQRLSRLYSELDLVAAECIRRGIWDGLNPAELAACVSVLSFESRKQSDDAEPARLPGGPVRDVLTAMGRTWAELDQLERRNGLSFLREPDSGFVWAAYRWVRGAKLEDVLDSAAGEPTAGEPAPRDRDVAATARAAIDAMRRGVIAYTTLTD
jgi:ATP-dependent RNA helicase HelY